MTSIASMKISALMAMPMKSQPIKIKYAGPMIHGDIKEVPGTSIKLE